MTNPYVFIVGCPRSGTTLLQRMLNAHRQIAITPESHWILRLFKSRKGLTPEGIVNQELLCVLTEDLDRRFGRWHIGKTELSSLLGIDHEVSYASFVSGLFDLYGKVKGKPLVGNKTPGFVRRLETIHALWPQARIVHLIRDGRDLYLSMHNRPLHHPKRSISCTWAEDPASTGALWWESNVRLGRQVGASLGSGLYFEMRYESLVARPAEECEALCRFLSLPYDPAILRFHEGRTKTTLPTDAKQAWLPPSPESPEIKLRPITPGLRDWRTQMSSEDVEQFEAAAGEFLAELGYVRSFPHPRPEGLEKASRVRERFTREFRA